jgi:hypothetical protein
MFRFVLAIHVLGGPARVAAARSISLAARRLGSLDAAAEASAAARAAALEGTP